MAININADTTTGLQLESDTSGNINIQNDGTTVVAVTSSGAAVTGNLTVDTNTLYVDATNNRVGIGTSSPTQNLQIYNNAATSGQIHITNSSTGATASDGVVFGYDGSNDVVILNRENTGIKIYTNGSLCSTFASDGNFFVGTTTAGTGPTTGFNLTYAGGASYSAWGHPSGTASGQPWCVFAYNGSPIGSIVQSGTTATLFNTTSDYRLKENNVNITDGIDRLKLLKPYRFNFITEPDRTVDGFYAHEVQSVVPEAINGTKDAVDDENNPVYQGIDQSKLVPLLTAALQEAIKRIEDLETRIQALENA